MAGADAQHEVVINHDWTVKTQHDMHAERIASALGSETACWAFVARTVPAWRYALGLLSGHIDVREFRTHDGHYRSSPVVNCGAFRYAANAAWVALAVTAFNLARATAVAASMRRVRWATLRKKIFNVPARIATTSRRIDVHMPADWPWGNGWESLWQAATGPPAAAAA